MHTNFNILAFYQFCISRFVFQIEPGYNIKMKVNHYCVENKGIKGKNIL